jgi:hypothetical protein
LILAATALVGLVCVLLYHRVQDQQRRGFEVEVSRCLQEGCSPGELERRLKDGLAPARSADGGGRTYYYRVNFHDTVTLRVNVRGGRVVGATMDGSPVKPNGGAR